jgi:hypothetical protein
MTARLDPSAKLCRTCRSPVAQRRHSYCQEHRQTRCPECHLLGGRHQGHCRWTERQHRLPSVRHNVVTGEDVALLYDRLRRYALGAATRIVGRQDAPDVVQSAVVYLWRRREYLRACAPQYFLLAVRHGAIRQAIRARRRRAVVVSVGDAQSLVGVEERMQRVALGRAASQWRRWA